MGARHTRVVSMALADAGRQRFSVHFAHANRSLNVVLLSYKTKRNAPDLSIYSFLIRKVSDLSLRMLVKEALPWVRTMDHWQGVANSLSNASQAKHILH